MDSHYKHQHVFYNVCELSSYLSILLKWQAVFRHCLSMHESLRDLLVSIIAHLTVIALSGYNVYKKFNDYMVKL